MSGLSEEYRASGEVVALVPTMGALHEGHLSLFAVARRRADRVVASIFVNPMQFDRADDLEAYPRDLDADLDAAARAGVDVVFAPEAGEVYPPDGAGIAVDPGPLADTLEGSARPGHFRGVLTVVTKLFGMVRPHLAVFGQKDFQQSVLVRRLVEDLNLPVEIVIAPTLREPDGLAMSSRNRLLDPEARRVAAVLHQGLQAGRAAFRGGTRSRVDLEAAIRAPIRARPEVDLEYVEIVDGRTLRRTDVVSEAPVASLAASVGGVRLIDNVPLGDGEGEDAGGGEGEGAGEAGGGAP
jgi:pantoate--beta-alanine ligase